jgi:tRNA G10  N-methylase Trm11
MLADLREFFRESDVLAINLSLAADARNIPLKNNSVDFIITSPPYLTRIDYAVSTHPELSVFGNSELLTYLRHNTMGAPVITKGPKHQLSHWGDICNKTLNLIAEHPTKAARSYYWKNIVQYFMDMDLALEEIKRVLKPGGQALIVVQSSYFKDIEISLGDIYTEMGQNKGFTSEIAFREEVKGHMAHVNTKSSAYKKNKIYFEDFVHLTKT